MWGFQAYQGRLEYLWYQNLSRKTDDPCYRCWGKAHELPIELSNLSESTLQSSKWDRSHSFLVLSLMRQFGPLAIFQHYSWLVLWTTWVVWRTMQVLSLLASSRNASRYPCPPWSFCIFSSAWIGSSRSIPWNVWPSESRTHLETENIEYRVSGETKSNSHRQLKVHWHNPSKNSLCKRIQRKQNAEKVQSNFKTSNLIQFW